MISMETELFIFQKVPAKDEDSFLFHSAGRFNQKQINKLIINDLIHKFCKISFSIEVAICSFVIRSSY